MNSFSINEIEEEIRTEYRKIDNRWLSLRHKISVMLVIFSHTVEIVMSSVVINSQPLNTTLPIFILKFVAIPCMLNLLCILAEHKAVYSKNLSQKSKIYIVSLLSVFICFVLLTVHVVYSALYFIFGFPIILTTVYADYRITAVTSFFSIALVVVSELFIVWDINKVSIWDNSICFGDFTISLFILCTMFLVSMVIIKFEREKNSAGIQKEIERHELRRKLNMDELTGIYNRRAFHDALKDMEEDNSATSYIFVMIDIDNFKSLNDTFGHFAGDKCLIELGRIMKRNSEDGAPFRYGGDEFCILFKNLCIDQVVNICRKIQEDLKGVSSKVGLSGDVTVSIGISRRNKNIDMARMIVNTDHALYEAKAVKNAIRVYEEPEKRDVKIGG